ncbi:MAG: FHA domain-containing protein [Acidobacteria bacterium]|nr:FHA domain-containing protein [Acidobacteriota bacterium]
MKAKLISKEYGEFVFDQLATIGRAQGSTVTLEATVVSSEHARISFDAQRSAYVLEDLGSLNGTQLDGVRIERKEVLDKLHLVCFGGGVDFIFQLLNAEEATELDTIELPPVGKTDVDEEMPVLPAALREEPSGTPGAEVGAEASTGAQDRGATRAEGAPVPVPEVLAQAGAAPASGISSEPALVLEFVLDDESLRFPLEQGENVVGRSKTADIRLDLADLSRRHATLTVSGGGVLVRDEGSRNHTFVDGEQIEKEVAVSVGTKIVFGRVEARLVAGPVTGPATETKQAMSEKDEPEQGKS